MQTTFLRLILAAGAVTLYALAAFVVWGRFFDGPWPVDASAYRWSLSAGILFLGISIWGGIFLLVNVHERRSFFAGMGSVIAAAWGLQSLISPHQDAYGLDIMLNMGFRILSVLGAFLIFYLIALKHAEAEAAT